MELHQLRYFAAVAEERHFTKAARGLGVAQPSVSRAIRVLEEELGAPLFHRMKGNVALTPSWNDIFPQGESILPGGRIGVGNTAGAHVDIYISVAINPRQGVVVE